MDIFTFHERMIQLDHIADADSDGVIIECWDVTSGLGQGLLFSLLDRPGSLLLRAELNDIPVELVEEVLRRVRGAA